MHTRSDQRACRSQRSRKIVPLGCNSDWPRLRSQGALHEPILASCTVHASDVQVIGAQPQLTKFVKHGCEEAEVEIELKGKPGRNNIRIKRVINNKDDTSVFFVAGPSLLPFASSLPA